jgi:hypothetical protein
VARQEAILQPSKDGFHQPEEARMEPAIESRGQKKITHPKVLPNSKTHKPASGGTMASTPTHRDLAPHNTTDSLTHPPDGPAVYVRKHCTGEDVDTPAVTTISPRIKKLKGGWSPALYGEQPWDIHTVLSDPLTSDTLREDCLEIYNGLSQRTNGYSKTLPWFVQVEQYISRDESTLKFFTQQFRDTDYVETYVRGRAQNDKVFDALINKLGPNPLFPQQSKKAQAVRRRRPNKTKVRDV